MDGTSKCTGVSEPFQTTSFQPCIFHPRGTGRRFLLESSRGFLWTIATLVLLLCLTVGGGGGGTGSSISCLPFVSAHLVDPAQVLIYANATYFWNFSSAILNPDSCAVYSGSGQYCEPSVDFNPPSQIGMVVDLSGQGLDLTRSSYYYPYMMPLTFPISTLSGNPMPDTGIAGWSFSAWIYIPYYVQFGYWPLLTTSLSGAASSANVISFNIKTVTGGLLLNYYDALNGECDATFFLVANRWMMVSITQNSLDETLMYVDGEIAASCSLLNAGEPSRMPVVPRDQLGIGYDATYPANFAGKFAMTALWNRTLSAHEHAILARTPPNTLGLFRFAFDPQISSPFLGEKAGSYAKLDLPLPFVPVGPLPLGANATNDVVLLLNSNPPGCVTPTQITWSPYFGKSFTPFSVNFTNLNGVATIVVNFTILSQPAGFFPILFVAPDPIEFRNLTGADLILQESIFDWQFQRAGVDAQWEMEGYTNASMISTLGWMYLKETHPLPLRSYSLANPFNLIGAQPVNSLPIVWNPTRQGWSVGKGRDMREVHARGILLLMLSSHSANFFFLQVLLPLVQCHRRLGGHGFAYRDLYALGGGWETEFPDHLK